MRNNEISKRSGLRQYCLRLFPKITVIPQTNASQHQCSRFPAPLARQARGADRYQHMGNPNVWSRGRLDQLVLQVRLLAVVGRIHEHHHTHRPSPCFSRLVGLSSGTTNTGARRGGRLEAGGSFTARSCTPKAAKRLVGLLHSRDAEGRFRAAFFFASFQKKLRAA